MQTLTQQQVKSILDNAPANLDKKMILQTLVQKGYQLEGFPQQTVTPVQEKPTVQDAIAQGQTNLAGTTQALGNIGKNIIQDYSQAGQNIQEGIKTSANQIATGENTIADAKTLKEGVKGVQEVAKGVGRAGLRTVGNIAGAAFAPITEVIKPLIEPAITKLAAKPEFQHLVNPIIEYANAHPEAAKDVQNLVDIFTLGVGGAVEKPLINAVEKGVQTGVETATAIGEGVASGVAKAGEVAGNVANKVGKGLNVAAGELENAGKAALEGRDAKILSIFSGESTDAVQKAIDNPIEADLGIKGGDEALRNAVQKGADSSVKARESFVQAHGEAFNKLAGENAGKLVKGKKVLYNFVDELTNKGVKFKKGKLDFSTSDINANPGEVSKINAAYEAVKGWDDWSLKGTNKLKQIIGKYRKFATEQGGSSKSPILGKFYNYLDNQIKENLPKEASAAYSDMNKKFTDTIGLYDDMVDAFNSGDPFTKLSGIFGANKDTLRQVIDFYEKTTGNKISPIVAGRTLAEEKSAAFGFLNPRSWIDFFVPPKVQAKVVTGYGKLKK